jgi:ankyrin repeat protein
MGKGKPIKNRETRKNRIGGICSKKQRGGGEEEDAALIDASTDGNIEDVKNRLDAGADVDAKNRHDCTALFMASHNAHTGVVKMLLDRGADVNEKNDYNENTALILATLKGHET